MLARVVHFPVAGSHSSAARTEPLALLKPGALEPPVASTVPSGNSVAFNWRRAKAMSPVGFHSRGLAFRSTTSAVAVGGFSPPPTIRILPGSYITADP